MIYVSTGGEKNSSGNDYADQLINVGIYGIELSGGKFQEDQESKLINKSIVNSDINFAIHNYFPPPSDPFVINLASLNQEISEMSLEQVVRSIKLCKKLGLSYYSVHAGFLVDPRVGELGKKFGNNKLYDRDEAVDHFVKNVNFLSDIAKENQIILMIENNVVTKTNLHNFESNPFLMAAAEDCEHVMKNVPENVRMLVDVAHLKVSSNTLNFAADKFLERCGDWIEGYHLSENNGSVDSNDPFEVSSWFWPHIQRDKKYYSIEVYGIPPDKLKVQLDLASELLGV